MFVDKVCDDIFWNETFRETAKKVGLEKLAITTTALGKKYFGLSDGITWCNSAEDEAVDAMLSFLIKSGNFGVKQKKNNLIDIVGQKRSLIGWLRHLQRAGEINWKLLKKYPKFKCFAWLYQIISKVKRHTNPKLQVDGMRNVAK